MTPLTESFEFTAQSLKASLEALLPASTGHLEMGEFKSPQEVTIKITSTRAQGAPIDLTLDKDFGAYITVGKGSVFEIPFKGKRRGGNSFLEIVTTLIRAITQNGFEEYVLLSNGVVVGASGIIRRGGPLPTDVRESWRKLRWNPFSKREREHHTYTPY
jgi:hypothetical protein